MDKTAKISFSAVTHIGTAVTSNDDRIYANGRFTYGHNADCTQISLEESGDRFLFALSDGMDTEDSGISAVRELKKFQQKASNSSKDIYVKLNELVGSIEQSSNLLHSVSLGENAIRGRKTAFAGLYIENGGVAAVNMGSSKVYKLEGGNIKLMVDDYKRAERLLKMGIINDEQAEMLSGQRKVYDADGRPPVKHSDVYALREGTVFLLCSGGLVESVSEDAIYDVMASEGGTDEIADKLVAEAVRNGCEDNATAIVVKVCSSQEAEAEEAESGVRVRETPARSYRLKGSRYTRLAKKQGPDMAKLVSTAIIVIVVAAVIFGIYTLWVKLRNPDAENASSIQNTTTVSDSIQAGSTQTTDEAAGGLEEDTQAAVDQGDGQDVSADSDNGGQGKTGNTGSAAGSGSKAGSGSTSKTGSGSGGSSAASDKEGSTYIVKPGDSLMKISVKFYGAESKYKLLMEANGLTDPNKIQVGQVLKIPASD